METCDDCPLIEVSKGINSLSHLLIARNLLSRQVVLLSDLAAEGLSNGQIRALEICLSRHETITESTTVDKGREFDECI